MYSCTFVLLCRCAMSADAPRGVPAVPRHGIAVGIGGHETTAGSPLCAERILNEGVQEYIIFIIEDIHDGLVAEDGQV